MERDEAPTAHCDPRGGRGVRSWSDLRVRGDAHGVYGDRGRELRPLDLILSELLVHADPQELFSQRWRSRRRHRNTNCPVVSTRSPANERVKGREGGGRREEAYLGQTCSRCGDGTDRLETVKDVASVAINARGVAGTRVPAALEPSPAVGGGRPRVRRVQGRAGPWPPLEHARFRSDTLRASRRHGEEKI